jgi:hypothetical protein
VRPWLTAWLQFYAPPALLASPSPFNLISPFRRPTNRPGWEVPLTKPVTINMAADRVGAYEEVWLAESDDMYFMPESRRGGNYLDAQRGGAGGEGESYVDVTREQPTRFAQGAAGDSYLSTANSSGDNYLSYPAASGAPEAAARGRSSSVRAVRVISTRACYLTYGPLFLGGLPCGFAEWTRRQ